MSLVKQIGIAATPQALQNSSFDPEFGVSVAQGLGYDGQNVVRNTADDQQIKAVSSGGYYYFCFAAVGTAEATEKWKVFRVDSTGNKVYADGDANYDNSAADPATLTYSYT